VFHWQIKSPSHQRATAKWPQKETSILLGLHTRLALAFLSEPFPQCFVPIGSRERVRALALGTDQQVMAAVQVNLDKSDTLVFFIFHFSFIYRAINQIK